MADKIKAPPGRILVVEDDWDILEVLKLMLEDEGHRVVTAKHGRAALALVAGAGKPFDVIVMDISMPEMSGIEVAQALRANPKTADVRIVIHTALEERWVKERFADYDLFLTKAHDADVLLSRIAGLLAKPRHAPGGAAAAAPVFGTEDLVRGQRALRAAMGLGAESMKLGEFLELLGAEIAQLRRIGQSDEKIAALLGEAVGRPIGVEAIKGLPQRG